MTKIGRNQPCPCGSGKKYKRCHGQSAASVLPSLDDPTAGWLRSRAEARTVQRQRQQGLGRPIISAPFQGQRFVAVRSRLLHSAQWNTFHDFLMDYIKAALGPAWGNQEIAKPPDLRHPLLHWYQTLCAQQRRYIQDTGKVQSMPMTGAAAAYMRLAYDLYALDHNAELQERLLTRLRNREGFSGARYEVFVAALFIRAGFGLAFENEQDTSSTHCEFVATHPRTGKRFSVEAKRREGRRLRIGHLFNEAQSKQAAHTRAIFIDMNSPDGELDEGPPAFLQRVLRRMRSLEDQPLDGQARPPAYVFLTNTPWEHHLDGVAPRCLVFAEGFQIPDFKEGTWMPSLRHMVDAREKHREMHDLMESIKDHSEIPSTFNGEIPEYAFSESAPAPITVGSRYRVPGPDGVEQVGVITAATVAESERVAYCAFTFADGQGGIYTIPLTDAEIAAWRRYPDTFFGVLTQRNTQAESPLELYDFIHDSMKRCTREQLLAVMADERDYETLKRLDQASLASVRAERLTNGAMAMGWNAAHEPRTVLPPSPRGLEVPKD